MLSWRTGAIILCLTALAVWAWPRPLRAPAEPLPEASPPLPEVVESIPSPPPVKLVFGGDVMLGRDIAQKYQDESFANLFDGLEGNPFMGADTSFVNFEAPLSTAAAVPSLAANNLHFIAPSVATKPLLNAGITHAGLANNHTLTYGRTILEQTGQILKDAGLIPVGQPDAVSPLDLATSRPITLLNVNFVDGPLTGVIEAVAAAAAAGRYVIVIPHWGVEYQETHNKTQETMAKEWIAAGANLIVGGHPHVVQDAEVIDGVPVFYSIGNLVFDQYFSVETQRGLIVSVVLSDDAATVAVRSFKETRGRPSWLDEAADEILLESCCQALREAAASGSFREGLVFIK